MDSREKLSVLLSEYIRPALKLKGFRRRGSSFYRFEHGNWGVINFQRDSRSSPQRLEFTVNLGIALAALSPLTEKQWRQRHPPECDCDWRERLGILASGKDTWWTIDSATRVANLARELLDLLETQGVPKITKYLNDRAILDLWVSGRSPGLTNPERLNKLVRLLRKAGPPELLARFEAEAEAVRQSRASRSDQEELAAVLGAAGFTSVEGRDMEFRAPADWRQRASEMQAQDERR